MINRSIVTISFCASALVAVFVFAARDAADASPVATRAPKTVEVKMTNANQMFVYDPKDITIAVGDTVKWVAAGGSHNVAFWKDSIPAGAEAALVKAMAPTDTTVELMSKRFPTAGSAYTIVFAGVPKGVYKYRCAPHLMRGMVGTITVQ